MGSLSLKKICLRRAGDDSPHPRLRVLPPLVPRLVHILLALSISVLLAETTILEVHGSPPRGSHRGTILSNSDKKIPADGSARQSRTGEPCFSYISQFRNATLLAKSVPPLPCWPYKKKDLFKPKSRLRPKDLLIKRFKRLPPAGPPKAQPEQL